jgi:hypothetical protein
LEAGDILTLIHKPYFATELGLSPMTSSCPLSDKLPDEHDLTHRFPSATHSRPRILALGIMLLEIELGEGIELHRLDDDFCEDDDPIDNDDHYTTGRIILSPMWAKRKLYQAMKEMIEICIRPDTAKFGTDEMLACDNLYVYVVAPLGRLFRQAWSHDRDPESFNPDPVSLKSTEMPFEPHEPTHSSPQKKDGHCPHPAQDPGPPTLLASAVPGLKTSLHLLSESPQPTMAISGFEGGELLGDGDCGNTIEARYVMQLYKVSTIYMFFNNIPDEQGRTSDSQTSKPYLSSIVFSDAVVTIALKSPSWTGVLTSTIPTLAMKIVIG